MLKPQEWNALVLGNWTRWHPTLAAEVRGHLASVDGQIGTTDLANAIYPPQFSANEDGMRARKAIFRALQTLATGDLSDCSSRGPEKSVMGRPARAWLWHASRGKREDTAADIAAMLASLSQLRLAARAMLDALNDLPVDAEGYTKIAGMDPEALATLNSAWSTLESAAAEKPIT